MKNWKIKITTLLAAIGLVSVSTLQAQNKNVVKETYKVSGNCGMCKKTIETAATKKASDAEWSEEKKELKVSYDPGKTNADEILKAVAYSGYDNEKYFAPQAAYSKLPDCCQYERSAKALASNKNAYNKTDKEQSPGSQQEKVALESVYALYFSVKDALVKTDANTASSKSKELMNALSMVKMESLNADQHKVFMKYVSNLKTDAVSIGESKDISKQREHFTTLSQNMYEVMKGIKPSYTVYLDHCPMFNDGKGANWVSKESAIKNPYYGSQMMTCGKISETSK
ncbi:mercury transporter [Sphingobacteriaceae bacterium]|nr:mercury transporter [Sphingobacteriaceae bacterium]